jgi:hypothetical protein
MLFHGIYRLKPHHTPHHTGIIEKELDEIKRLNRCNKQDGSGWNLIGCKATIKDNLRTTRKCEYGLVLNDIKIYFFARHLRLTPVILATWEAKIWRTQFEASPGKIVWEIPSQQVLARICHNSYSGKLKTGGLWSRPAQTDNPEKIIM